MKRLTRGVLLFGLIAASTVTTASAAVTNLLSFDEFGHGLILTNGMFQSTFTGMQAPDPTGGLLNWNVLMYTLPFLGTAGDVLVRDPAVQGTPILDVLRFDGASHLIVYSDSVGGYDTPADTPGPPDPFSNNFLLVDKTHVNLQLAFADFTPALNGPGWDVSNPNYHFLDPGVIPEPGSCLLFLSGLAAFGLGRMRRRFTSRHHTTGD